MKGKAYANRKPVNERPKNDFYQTPRCLTKELVKTGLLDEAYPILERNDITILDPCCGHFSISSSLEDAGFRVTARDLIYGDDFLEGDRDERYCAVVMNPPFKLFDKFVTKAKSIAPVVCCIGKMNYFGAHSRNVGGLWRHLEWVLPFDRMISFESPERDDGKVECGMMVTGWFIWNKSYEGFPKVKVIDVQDYILKK